jgi:hypothetical protein
MANWMETEMVRETPEQYYLPAVEMLDVVFKKRQIN